LTSAGSNGDDHRPRTWQNRFRRAPAGIDIEYTRSSVGFTWEGFDEMHEVSGYGSADDDGSIAIEFADHNGDEAVLKANGRIRRP
jgi:hypothetical protein